MKYIQVSTTTDNLQDAQRIAQELVERRIAGCVQTIGPIESIYWWKGEIERSQEWLLLIKTERRLYGEVEGAIKELHSYETPEIVATPLTLGSKEYLGWLKGEVKAP